MSDDEERQHSTTGDMSRLGTTTGDSAYSLSIEEALARYEAAGIPRTRRSVQRHCANGALDAHRVETTFGEKFWITPGSVDRHIAYINEVRPVATRHAPSRPDTTGAVNDHAGRPAATTSDVSPRVAMDARVVELLERENLFLREQIGVKDKQIAEQLERAHETNSLVNGLQRMLSPLLAAADHGDMRIPRKKIRIGPHSKNPFEKGQTRNAHKNFVGRDLNFELDAMLAHLLVSHAKRLSHVPEQRIIAF